MDLRGNFVLFGATLAHECQAGLPAPIVGTVGTCPDTNAFAPDVFWRADDPANGAARADSSVTRRRRARDRRARAARRRRGRLRASVLGRRCCRTTCPTRTVQLQRVDGDIDETITADDEHLARAVGHQPLLLSVDRRRDRAGATRRASARTASRACQLDARQLCDRRGRRPGTWSCSTSATATPRATSRSSTASTTSSSARRSAPRCPGSSCPRSGFDAKLGVVAYEGEDQLEGDQLLFNGTALTNAHEPGRQLLQRHAQPARHGGLERGRSAAPDRRARAATATSTWTWST